MSYASLTFEPGAIARLTFDTPAKLNAIDETRLREFSEVLDRLEADDAVRVLIVTGAGRAFCVGLDLELLKRAFEDVACFGSVTQRLGRVIDRLEALPFPTIAMVNGHARAGGFEIALACDFLLISAEARIGDNHAQVGVMPGGGSTARLPRRIGMQKAKALIFSGGWLSGLEAAACGLALEAHAPAALAPATQAFAETLAGRPRATLAAVKGLMARTQDWPQAAGVAEELRAFAAYNRTRAEPREGFWRSISLEPPGEGPAAG